MWLVCRATVVIGQAGIGPQPARIEEQNGKAAPIKLTRQCNTGGAGADDAYGSAR